MDSFRSSKVHRTHTNFLLIIRDYERFFVLHEGPTQFQRTRVHSNSHFLVIPFLPYSIGPSSENRRKNKEGAISGLVSYSSSTRLLQCSNYDSYSQVPLVLSKRKNFGVVTTSSHMRRSTMATSSPPTSLGAKDALAKTILSVFEKGSLNVVAIKAERSNASAPPKPLLIVTPTSRGSYPVLLFCHGFCIKNTWYTQLLHHISSHGFIVVAPQFYRYRLVSIHDEVKTAAKVTDWLSTSLQSVLPSKIHADLDKLALSGHSRGGNTAFALALGHASTSLKFSALLGLDPVAGSKPTCRFKPTILTYVPRSLNLSIPVAVIGTGLGNQPHGIIPPFAPNGVNHAEFFNESRPPCCYFLAKDYGHCDMLNDATIAALASLVCRTRKGSKDLMRRGVGGVAVAFLKAYLGDKKDDLEAVADGRLRAPITFDPIILIND